MRFQKKSAGFRVKKPDTHDANVWLSTEKRCDFLRQTIILGKILIIKAKSGNFFTSAARTGYHHPSRCLMTESVMKLTAYLLPVSLFCAVLPAAHAAITPLSPDTCRAMTALGIITPENPVPCERLVNVDVRFITFEGETRTGTITVADIIAPETEALFGELYRRKFPLHSVLPIEAFGGDDEASMAANNTSAFNGRRQASQKAWSKHAYGMAIDINPQQNPYRFREKSGRVTISPPQSAAALTNREAIRDGKMETVLPLVFSHGFLRRGGEWKNPVDFQHAEIGSFTFINHLLSLPLPDAQAEYSAYAARYRDCFRKSKTGDELLRARQCAKKVLR
ncbi:TPA: M15 family metallopeptidase [Morganella morganii subsp. sibonii]|nr:M15 family metallopeptidase [Morganella morganii]HDU8311511.1 M15 family metallopeptidase [Morganella morganii subsp. sibonii]